MRNYFAVNSVESVHSGNADKNSAWTPDGKRKQRRPRMTWRRTAEKELASVHFYQGVRPERWHRTGPTGGILWRPYGSLGAKRTDDDDDT